MNINKKILSLPPYISTSWSNVKALHMEGANLLVRLGDGEIIRVPDLAPEIIETVFSAHASFSNHQSEPPLNRMNPQSLFGSDDMAFRFGFAGIDGLGTALQHNPSQMNAPDIPLEVLQKIASIAKVIAPEDPNAIPKPEPHCNCMHCQIARAIHTELNAETEEEQETVQELEDISDDDLQFCQWEIQKTGDDLYMVTNRLDTHERYSVYLGHPVGCTCGKEGCEHILAILRN